jgi:transposase InsO family protein
MSALGMPLEGQVVHHDQDSVYTSYRWLRTILLDDGLRVSYSENGAKGNPWIESLWGRTKTEIGSRITEASSLPSLRTVFDERFQYYNQERRHSSIGYIPRSGTSRPENISVKLSIPSNQNLASLLRLSRN